MELIYESANFNVGTVGRVVVVAASSAMTLDHVNGLEKAYAALRASHGTFLSITVTTSPKPGISDDARRRLQVVTKEYRPQDKGSAVVMAEGGFANSVVRAIVGSVTLIAGANIRIFGDVDLGLNWLGAMVARERLDGFDPIAIREGLARLANRSSE
jgi:hypothetical protein